MTNVNMVYRRPDGVHAEGTLLTAADGSVAISSVVRYDTSDGEMTRVAFTVPLNTQNVFMDPGTWNFELIGVSDGKGGYLTGDDAKSTRIVPASGTFDVDDLTEVLASGGPALPDALTARVAALESALGGVSGGASTLASITNMSADGRTLLVTPNSFATMRGLLGAAAAGAAPTAHTHVATTDLTATGTKSSATFLRGDNTWAAPPAAGSPAWTDITGKPTVFPPDVHTHTVTDIVGEAAPISALLSATTALAARTAIGAADGATTALIRIPWRQVGSAYPTPLPDGFYGFDFEGQLDPRTQAGITVNPNTDKWTQLP